MLKSNDYMCLNRCKHHSKKKSKVLFPSCYHERHYYGILIETYKIQRSQISKPIITKIRDKMRQKNILYILHDYIMFLEIIYVYYMLYTSIKSSNLVTYA